METQKDQLLAFLASRIPLSDQDCTLVGIDGRDGAGKTSFANDFATVCRRYLSPRQIIRISIDDFHNIKDIRYRRGPTSPEGFFLDSYDYSLFHQLVLKPLGPNGTRRYKTRSHDLATDRVVAEDEPVFEAPRGSVVIIDGISLHRPELIEGWDLSIFLDVSAETCAQRMLIRDGGPSAPSNDRYTGGQRMYFDSCMPWDKADYVIDNTDYNNPVLQKKQVA